MREGCEWMSGLPLVGCRVGKSGCAKAVLTCVALSGLLPDYEEGHFAGHSEPPQR